ncbi:pilus assembly protein [Sphingobium sufflavum]|nr:pilus assembly protein [Sphingobium sufflavum]
MVEFALILPVLCTLLLGALDFAHSLYMQSVLQGSLQKAARDSSLETGTEAAKQTELDTKVRDQIQALYKDATVSFSRRFYRSFSKAAAAQAETFVDSPVGNIWRDGLCNNGEAFVDANNNGVWDKDGGDAGQGRARDVVVYTVTVTYPRLLPVDKFVGGSGTNNFLATTVLTNQPYGDQGTYGTATAGVCPAS